MKRSIRRTGKRPPRLLGLVVLCGLTTLLAGTLFAIKERGPAPRPPAHSKEKLYPAYDYQTGLPVPPVEVIGILKEEPQPVTYGPPYTRKILHLEHPITVTIDLVDPVTHDPVDAGDPESLRVYRGIATLQLLGFDSGPVRHPIEPFLNKRIKVRGILELYFKSAGIVEFLFLRVDMGPGTNVVLLP